MVLIIIFGTVNLFYKKPIPANEIPKKNNIVSMIVIKDDIKKEIDSETQEKLLELMSKSYSGLIKKQTQDDFPRVENYFTIYFVTLGKSDGSYFVYNNSSQYFLERPYNGIYYTSKELYTTLEDMVYK